MNLSSRSGARTESRRHGNRGTRCETLRPSVGPAPDTAWHPVCLACASLTVFPCPAPARRLKPTDLSTRSKSATPSSPSAPARLERAIAKANRDHAAALLVELDTPGGLLNSTRQMVGDMLSSRDPPSSSMSPHPERAPPRPASFCLKPPTSPPWPPAPTPAPPTRSSNPASPTRP